MPTRCFSSVSMRRNVSSSKTPCTNVEKPTPAVSRATDDIADPVVLDSDEGRKPASKTEGVRTQRLSSGAIGVPQHTRDVIQTGFQRHGRSVSPTCRLRTGSMRIAIVYDCLFPHTVGGAERWYRELAERLGGPARGHLSHPPPVGGRRSRDAVPGLAVAPGGPLYTPSGRRRIGPPLRFGLGVFWHLLRHASRYDAVHCASFPYFSLLGAWLALRLRRRGPLVVDWFELWTRDYWIEYLGPGRRAHRPPRPAPVRADAGPQLHASPACTRRGWRRRGTGLR